MFTVAPTKSVIVSYVSTHEFPTCNPIGILQEIHWDLWTELKNAEWAKGHLAHPLTASLMSPCWIWSSFLPPKGGFNTPQQHWINNFILVFSGFGECGANAECEAVDHAATCKCPEGTRELNSPYVACVPSDLDLSTISCLRDSDCSFGLTCQSWQCRPS